MQPSPVCAATTPAASTAATWRKCSTSSAASSAASAAAGGSPRGEPRQQALAVGRLGDRLGGDRADPGARPGDDRADREPVRLHRDPELPARRIAGDERVGHRLRLKVPRARRRAASRSPRLPRGRWPGPARPRRRPRRTGRRRARRRRWPEPPDSWTSSTSTDFASEPGCCAARQPCRAPYAACTYPGVTSWSQISSGVSDPVSTAATTSSTVRGRSAPGSSAASGLPALSSGGTGASSSDAPAEVVVDGVVVTEIVVGSGSSESPQPASGARAARQIAASGSHPGQASPWRSA